MKIYVISGHSREYPEDSNRWIYGAYVVESKAQQVRDVLNAESQQIFELSPWNKIVEAIQVSSDPNMKHGDDAAEYYIEEIELDTEE